MTPEQKLDLFVDSFLKGMPEETKAEFRAGRGTKNDIAIFDTI